MRQISTGAVLNPTRLKGKHIHALDTDHQPVRLRATDAQLTTAEEYCMFAASQADPDGSPDMQVGDFWQRYELTDGLRFQDKQ